MHLPRTSKFVNLLLLWKCKGARDKKQHQNTIYWWICMETKERKEARKGIKMRIWCVWQNRKSLLWVSNAPFNESLSWIYNSSLQLLFRQLAAYEKRFVPEFDACFQLPYALFFSSKEKYLWTRAKFYESKSSPDDSIKNFFGLLFIFSSWISETFLFETLDSIWIGE